MIDKNNRLLYWRRGKGKWGDGIFEGGACLFHATLHMICFGRYLWVQWNCQRKEKCNVCCERNSSKEVNVILIILYIAMVYPPSCLCLCISTGVKYSLKKRLIYAHFAVTLASWQKVINEHWWVQFEMMGGGQLRRFKEQASPTGKTEISVFFLLQFLLQRLVVRFFWAKVWWVQVQVCCRWQWNYQQSQVCWYTNILLGVRTWIIFQSWQIQSGADNLWEALKERRDGEPLCLPLQRALRQEGDENLDGGVGRCWQDYNSLQT